MMGLFKPKPDHITFKKAAEKTRKAIEAAEERAESAEDWISVASAWQELTSELNPAGMDDKPEKKDK